MKTGIDDLDSLVEDGKHVVIDVRMKWKMKLWGLVVAGIGALVTRYCNASPLITKIGIGVIVVGVLMILGTDGIKFVLRELLSVGKSGPDVKL